MLSKFDESFIKNYNENCNKRYCLEINVGYLKNLFNLHSDLPFLPEGNKIKKCNKLVCNVHDKENYVVHIRALKQALNHGLIIKKVHRVIQFNQETWFKTINWHEYEIKNRRRNDFEKNFFKLMNSAVFVKTMENVRKHRDIKLVTTDKRRNQLASEPNYYTIKYFSENVMAIKMKNTKVKINKPTYLGISTLDISKTLMYEFWYDFIKPKYQNKTKLCYMDTDSLIIQIKTKDFYEDIANNVEKC